MSPFTSEHGRRSTNDAHATKSFLEHAIRPPNNTFHLGSFNSASSVHHITSFPHSTSLFPSNMHACFSSSFSLGIFPTPSNYPSLSLKKKKTSHSCFLVVHRCMNVFALHSLPLLSLSLYDQPSLLVPLGWAATLSIKLSDRVLVFFSFLHHPRFAVEAIVEAKIDSFLSRTLSLLRIPIYFAYNSFCIHWYAYIVHTGSFHTFH